MKEKPLFRNCPQCDGGIRYRYKGDYDKATRKGSLCKGCSAKANAANRDVSGEKNPFWGKTHTAETIAKIQKGDQSIRQTKAYRDRVSRQCSGSGNPMHGKTVYGVWVERYGQEEADRRKKEKAAKTSIQCSGRGNPMYGKPAPRGAGQGWKGWYKGWFFRSLKELSYMVNVIEKGGHEWESAETKDLRIGYVDWQGHERTYRADFLVDGNVLVEVKPKKLMNTPTNLAKRDAAIVFCKSRGLVYSVEEATPLSDGELFQLWTNKTITFQKRYNEMFKERYMV